MVKSVKLRSRIWAATIHTIMILFSLLFVAPICLIIASSLATQESLNAFGYVLFPKEITFDAYRYVFQNSQQIVDAYKLTTLLVVINIPLWLFLRGMTAYALTRARWGHKLIRFVYISSFFNGGLIPTYILITQYLHMGDSLWVYIIPGLYATWDIIVMRTFFKNHPTEIIEAAKMDGAREFVIYLRIIIPISLPLYATMAIFSFMGIWNQWMTTMLYIRNEKLFTLGYLLQSILKIAAFQKEMAEQAAGVNVDLAVQNLPQETIKYAMVIVAAGPAMFIMPFFQKYFKSGLIMGSIKG